LIIVKQSQDMDPNTQKAQVLLAKEGLESIGQKLFNTIKRKSFFSKLGRIWKMRPKNERI